MDALEEKIKYMFLNKSYLQTALSHSSYANEKKTNSNERLEFLGDSVLGFLTAKFLYSRFMELPEGDLSKIRAALVCEQALEIYANEINLSEFLLLGKGEEITGGRSRPSIIADAFEALLGALYLDGGMETAKKFVIPFLENYVEKATQGKTFMDYKTILQEVIQKNPGELLDYVLTDESGPDHSKFFICEVHINSNVISKGKGRSKKEAEQSAAKEALLLMGIK